MSVSHEYYVFKMLNMCTPSLRSCIDPGLWQIKLTPTYKCRAGAMLLFFVQKCHKTKVNDPLGLACG